MLPGQIGILIIALTSAALLAVMGVVSYFAWKRASFERLLEAAKKRAPVQESSVSTGTAHAVEDISAPTPAPTPKSKSGHNDFGFKF